MKTCGIYCIAINGKFYIGSSKNIESRYLAHLQALRKNKHHSIYLQRAYNKHGEKETILNIICIVGKEECLIEMEQLLLDVLNPQYNMSPTAGSPHGVKHTDQAKRNMSNAAKGRKWTEHQTMLQRERMKKYRATEETKQKQREAMQGFKHTEESKQKMSESAKKRAPLSQEAKDRKNAKLRGQKRSEETKKKQSIALKGKYIGRKHSEETKQKQSESLKRAYVEKRRVVAGGFKMGNKMAQRRKKKVMPDDDSGNNSIS